MPEGLGSALKPGYEPICLARKPLAAKNIAANVLAYGTGALNIDACRIEGEPWKAHDATGLASVKFFTNGEAKVIHKEPHNGGRWPANVILDETAAGLLDAMSGERDSGGPSRKPSGHYQTTADGGGYQGLRNKALAMTAYPDRGGASRFFLTAPIDDPDAEHLRFMYASKASRRERNAGLDGMPEQRVKVSVPPGEGRSRKLEEITEDGKWVTPPRANHHPTVKPLSLMRWLVRLVTPPGGVILDPFTGSGSTGCAAALEGFDFIGIEREAEYVEIARARIAHWTPKDAPQLALALGTVDTSASKGRWPANVLLDETAAALLDEQSGERDSGGPSRNPDKYARGSDHTPGWGNIGVAGAIKGYADTGGASRFFFTAHADQEEEAS